MIPLSEPVLGEEELQYVAECIKTNWVSSVGKYVDLFEEKFAKYCGRKFAVATSSGTTALHLALVVLSIGKDDEVIVPSLTFIATANAVTYTGAIPVFVDSELSTWNIDPDRIEKAISKKTKAILPVHLYGHPADMDKINKIAKNYGLLVVEDATEGLGALYKGKKVGTLGDIACFSFNGNKLITTGGGGMIVTDDEDIAKKAKMLSCQGRAPGIEYYHPYIGYNYRLTNLQAALGVAQMEKIDRYLAIKRKNAELYNTRLKDIKGIMLPPEMKWAKSAFWMYSILVEEDYVMTRDELIAKLRQNEIDSRPFFYPIHLQPPYAKKTSLRSIRKLEVAEKLYSMGINLPSSVSLKTDDIIVITDVIKSRGH